MRMHTETDWDEESTDSSSDDESTPPIHDDFASFDQEPSDNESSMPDHAPGSPVDTRKLEKVRHVLDAMDQAGITLPAFLDAISWGDPACTQDHRVRAARSSLMKSEELPRIVRHWWQPPTSHGKQATSAKEAMVDFSQQCLGTIISKEMRAAASLFASKAGEDVTRDHLTSFEFNTMIQALPRNIPAILAKTPTRLY
ncbi:hypothetical protein LshimejAT787_1003590 [Lyophyllum shimeji]|uniref:Uncharacterized protein n=1 Tax=Lyophyllum shimeji TaxID=47721 RepID=A0A9P3PUH2_LYOSH|nr:hypothetical protein LshimejAT787_1003590 [Lyophyllum shimeji]